WLRARPAGYRARLRRNRGGALRRVHGWLPRSRARSLRCEHRRTDSECVPAWQPRDHDTGRSGRSVRTGRETTVNPQNAAETLPGQRLANLEDELHVRAHEPGDVQGEPVDVFVRCKRRAVITAEEVLPDLRSRKLDPADID